MAKNDLFSSLTAVAERDERSEQNEQFYRPAAPSKARPLPMREIDAGRRAPRAWPEPAAKEEDGGQEPFLRSRRRVPIRRGLVPKTRTGRILFATVTVLVLVLLVVLALSVRDFLRDDPRFRIDSASSIQIMGNSQLTRRELLSVFGSDIGRNVFFVPLRERRAELERLPWVAHATVMRLLPDQLRVSIVERVPIAFFRDGNAIKLVDVSGVPLEMSPAMIAVKHYSFPVITGIAASDPLPVRAARMRLYQQFIDSLNSGGAKLAAQLSEVDLSDPEDVRVVMPAQGTGILVHFGQGDFLERYRIYQRHLGEWLRQYPHLASVDLRYDGQVVLGMAQEPGAAPGAEQEGMRPPATPAAGQSRPHRIAAAARKAGSPAKNRAAHHAQDQKSRAKSAAKSRAWKPAAGRGPARAARSQG